MHSKRLIGLFLLAAATGLCLEVQAQQLGRVDIITSNAGTYYYHVEPGEATVQVSAMGSVRQPGLYEVGVGTNLQKLLVLAGGPQLDPRTARVNRDVRITLFRHGSPRPVYSASLDETVAQGRSTPQLQEGDALMVEVVDRERFNWRDTFTVIGGLSTVVLIVRYVTDLSN
jgi:hypothetical protein